jgi:hypothetical protein
MWFPSRALRACGQPLDQGWALQKRLYIGLLVALAAAALSFGLNGAGKQARSETRTAPSEAARPATRETPPIPEAGPLAEPKSLDQIGLPAELTRQAIPADNPQTPEKIALGEKLFCRSPLRRWERRMQYLSRSRPRVHRSQADVDRDQGPRRPAQRPDHSERSLQQGAVLGRPGKYARAVGGAADRQSD